MNIPLKASLVTFNEIIDNLNKVMEDKDLDDFTRARIIKESEMKAQELKDMNHAEGFSALGSVACAKNDIKMMHKNHKLSIKYSADALTLFNYAASLSKCGELEDALSYGKVAYDINPTDENSINFMVSVADEVGDNKTFLRFSAAWEKLTDAPHPLYLEYLDSLRDLKDITQMCMEVSEHAMSKIWDTPEEDEAWAHLQ